MHVLHNPSSNGPHPGPISWGMETRSPRRLLYISGQVGTDASGNVADGFLAQAKCTWDNVGAVLRAAGMTPDNIVRTGIYIPRQVELTTSLRTEFNALRIGFLGSNRPSSTMIYVYDLMDPAWLVEIDAVAVET